MNRRSKIAYGVDVSERHLSVVRARGRNDVETLVQAGSPKLPEGLRAQIAADVASGRATSAAAMACHETVLRPVSAPISRFDRALKVLPSLLDVQLPFPLEQCAFLFTGAAPNANGGLDALAVAARREDVQHALQKFIAAGFDPVLLDQEGLALWRQAQCEFSAGSVAGRVQIHLGPAHTTLAYGRGGKFLGAHSSRLGGTDAPPAEIASRIQSWLRAQTALSISPQTEWIFSGAGAADSARVGSLRDALQISGDRTVENPAMFLARALAARALEEDGFFCNLRTGEQEHPQSKRQKETQISQVLFLALAASVALIAVNAGALFFSSKRNDAAQHEAAKIAFELSSAPAPKGQEVLVVRRALDEKKSAQLPFQQMLAPSGGNRLTEILALCRANSAVISHLAFAPDSLRIEAEETQAGAADRIVTTLRARGWQMQSSKRGGLIVLEGKR